MKNFKKMILTLCSFALIPMFPTVGGGKELEFLKPGCYHIATDEDDAVFCIEEDTMIIPLEDIEEVGLLRDNQPTTLCI